MGNKRHHGSPNADGYRKRALKHRIRGLEETIRDLKVRNAELEGRLEEFDSVMEVALSNDLNSRPFKYVCNECDSENVQNHALVTWNKALQSWEISDVHGDELFCGDCDVMGTIVIYPMDSGPFLSCPKCDKGLVHEEEQIVQRDLIGIRGGNLIIRGETRVIPESGDNERLVCLSCLTEYPLPENILYE